MLAVASYLCHEVANHGEVIVLHGMVESRLARLAVLNINVSLSIHQQLNHISAAILGSKVEWGVPCNYKRSHDYHTMDVISMDKRQKYEQTSNSISCASVE